MPPAGFPSTRSRTTRPSGLIHLASSLKRCATLGSRLIRDGLPASPDSRINADLGAFLPQAHWGQKMCVATSREEEIHVFVVVSRRAVCLGRMAAAVMVRAARQPALATTMGARSGPPGRCEEA